METNTDQMLSRLAGHIEGLIWLPYSREMENNTLNRVMCAIGDIAEAGIPLRCKDVDERAELADLVARGLLARLGRTQGQKVRLNAPCIFACWCSYWDITTESIVDVFNQIKEAPKVVTPWKQPVVMGYDLVKTAGKWWNTCTKSDEAWNTYVSELLDIHKAIIPLMVCGWLRTYISSSGLVWGIDLTEAGKNAMIPKSLPTISLDFDEWDKAYKESLSSYARNPPDNGSRVSRRLPDSAWR